MGDARGRFHVGVPTEPIQFLLGYPGRQDEGMGARLEGAVGLLLIQQLYERYQRSD